MVNLYIGLGLIAGIPIGWLSLLLLALWHGYKDQGSKGGSQ